jgi:hypothetical protein
LQDSIPVVLIAATAEFAVVHEALLVRFAVLRSLSMAIACSCALAPGMMLTAEGVTSISAMPTQVLFTLVAEPSYDASTLVFPGEMQERTPELLTVSIAGFPVDQVTLLVTSEVPPPAVATTADS